MSLRALKDLRQRTQDEIEDTGRPYDAAEELIERQPDETWLECIVYLNSAHPIVNDLDELKRRLLTEIAPHYRTFVFQGFAEDELRVSSPFSTRAAENRFLQRGYARGPGQWPAPEPAPRRTAGNRAHHLSYQESQEALQVLTLLTERALRTIRRQIPRRQRPAWLDGNIDTILAPVCGRVSTNVFARAEAADDRAAAVRDDAMIPDAAPIIPIVREGGLLLGCTDFERRRTVLPSHVSTPQSAAREGRAALKRWSEAGRCDLYADSATEQIKRELADRAQHFGAEFDLAGAALWLCQCVMQMRLSVEDVRRRTAASWFAHEDKQEAQWVENRRLLDQLRKGYGAAGDRTIVVLEPPTLARRILELFHGVGCDTWADHDTRDPDAYALAEALAFVRWIRQLRLAGNATLNHSLALDICNFIEREDPYFIRLFSGREGQQVDDLLGDMLPEPGWQALYDAACIIRDDKADLAFAVTYGWRGLTEHGPSGHVHPDERRVEIVGPLLMLPLHAADYWRDKARRIPAEGLYAYVE